MSGKHIPVLTRVCKFLTQKKHNELKNVVIFLSNLIALKWLPSRESPIRFDNSVVLSDTRTVRGGIVQHCIKINLENSNEQQTDYANIEVPHVSDNAVFC